MRHCVSSADRPRRLCRLLKLAAHEPRVGFGAVLSEAQAEALRGSDETSRSRLAPMADFRFQQLFEFGADETPYREPAGEQVRVDSLAGREILTVEPTTLRRVASEAVRDI